MALDTINLVFFMSFSSLKLYASCKQYISKNSKGDFHQEPFTNKTGNVPVSQKIKKNIKKKREHRTKVSVYISSF